MCIRNIERTDLMNIPIIYIIEKFVSIYYKVVIINNNKIIVSNKILNRSIVIARCPVRLLVLVTAEASNAVEWCKSKITFKTATHNQRRPIFAKLINVVVVVVVGLCR